MWTIQEILKSDKEFEENYKNKTFDLKNAKINNIAALKFFINYNNDIRIRFDYFPMQNNYQKYYYLLQLLL